MDGVQEAQTVHRRAVIRDLERDVVAGFRAWRYRQPESIVLVREAHRLSVRRHACDRHPFTVRRRGREVEARVLHAVGCNAEAHGRFAFDLVRVRGEERQAEHVVFGVHARLTRIRVRERVSGQECQRDREQQDGGLRCGDGIVAHGRDHTRPWGMPSGPCRLTVPRPRTRRRTRTTVRRRRAARRGFIGGRVDG